MFDQKCTNLYSQNTLGDNCQMFNIPYEEKEYEIVMSTYNTADISVIKSVLNHEQIRFFFKGEKTLNQGNKNLPATLMVHKEEIAKTEELLQNLNANFICYLV